MDQLRVQGGIDDILFGSLFLTTTFGMIFQNNHLIFTYTIILMIFFTNYLENYLRGGKKITPKKMKKSIAVFSILFFLLYVAFLVFIHFRFGYPAFLMTYYISLFFWLLYYLIRFRAMWYGLYLLIAGLGLGVYWLFPNMNPVIRWVVSLGIPGLVILGNGILLFIRYKSQFSPPLLIEKAEKPDVKEMQNIAALPFLKTFWETFLFILQHWTFFIQYLALHVVYLLFFAYLIIGFNRFHLMKTVGSNISCVLLLLWALFLIVGFAFVNTLSIRAMKEAIENPGTRPLYLSRRKTSVNWVFTFFLFLFRSLDIIGFVGFLCFSLHDRFPILLLLSDPLCVLSGPNCLSGFYGKNDNRRGET